MKRSDIKVVLLDRDGVLNRKMPEGSYVCSLQELELLPGAEEAVRLLNENGILAIVLTNQRCIARGILSESALEAIHSELKARLAHSQARLDAIYYCPHDYHQCNCRKPATGMIERAFHDFPTATRSNTLLIGDSPVDIATGNTFGIPTVLIVGEGMQSSEAGEPITHVADSYAVSLLDAVREIVLQPA